MSASYQQTREAVIKAIQLALDSKETTELLSSLHQDQDIDLAKFDLTSLRLVEISMYIEDTLGLELDLEAIEELTTLNQLVALCE